MVCRIAYTMFMSVMERTRLIGLLKALGSTDNEVMKHFIMESGIFGFFGGIIGLIFGILISVMIFAVGLSTVARPQLIIFAFEFSVIVGVLSGVAPARSAAKMNPVDALRFEQWGFVCKISLKKF